MGARRYETTIGLEVHVQLGTRTKLFCACAPRFGDPPNSRLCPTCLGLPGALPVLNAAAVDGALRAAVALGCRVHRRSRFARKNYLYPDLPKGYQITQHRRPLATGGELVFDFDGARRRLGVERLHLEEDSGRLLHEEGERPGSGVDLNRCGTPLVEVVTSPATLGPAAAVAALQQLRGLLRWLELSDVRMEEGSLRCDANVSVRPAGQGRLNPKTELKNLNSFRLLRKALRHEEQRQRAVLEAGRTPDRSTRRWDPAADRTVIMRGKEAAPDYRFFPEPDLPELELDERRVGRARELPELPIARADRYVRDHALDRERAAWIVADRGRSDWFDAGMAAGADAGELARWLSGAIRALAKARADGDLVSLALAPGSVVELLEAVDEGALSENLAEEVLERMVVTGRPPRAIIQEDGLRALDDERALRAAVDGVVEDHPAEAERFRDGDDRLLGWFMGRVMAATEGRAEPGLTRALLKRRLSGDRG